MNEKEPYLPGLEPNDSVQDIKEELSIDEKVLEKAKVCDPREKWEAEVDACAECDKYGEACPRHMATKPQ